MLTRMSVTLRHSDDIDTFVEEMMSRIGGNRSSVLNYTVGRGLRIIIEAFETGEITKFNLHCYPGRKSQLVSFTMQRDVHFRFCEVSNLLMQMIGRDVPDTVVFGMALTVGMMDLDGYYGLGVF